MHLSERVCKSVHNAGNEQNEGVRDATYWCESSTQNYEFVNRIASLHVGQQELGLKLSGDKENVLWNSEMYRRLWELGHQLHHSDFRRPLSVMKKVCDTWTKHKTYLFRGCGFRLVSLKSLPESADEVRNDEQFRSEMNITSRSADQYWNSVLLYMHTKWKTKQSYCTQFAT